MTLVRLKNRPVSPSFNNLMDDFINGFPSTFKNEFPGANFKQIAPVNVKQIEGGYQIDVLAPGFGKDDFKVNIEADLLTISAEKKSEAENKEEKHIRKEYTVQSFKRSFSIDKNMDTENISAKYVNGILTLNLPTKETVKSSVKEITIQ